MVMVALNFRCHQFHPLCFTGTASNSGRVLMLNGSQLALPTARQRMVGGILNANAEAIDPGTQYRSPLIGGGLSRITFASSLTLFEQFMVLAPPADGS